MVMTNDLAAIPRNGGIEVKDDVLGMLSVNYAHCCMMAYDTKFDDEHKLNDRWWSTVRDLMRSGF